MIGTRSSPTREKHQPLVRLDGERVTLRPPGDEDYAEWEDVRRANYDYLKPFEPRWPEDCLTKSFYRRRLSRQLSDWREDRCYSFLIFEKGGSREEGRLAGGMNINNVTRGAAHFASVGYWIAQDFQGRGYMQESLLLTLSYGFSGLRLHRFNASCVPHNKRSRAVLERAGFRQEGYAAKYLQIDGIWQDHFLFGLNSEDWQAAPDIG
jgi:ribosomal-protein-alanine N-acetyltransferase